MASRKSDLPFAGNFSPEEVDLADVLTFAANAGGDRKALESAIRESYYERESTPPAQRLKLAYNVALGMGKYGLIEKDATLTPLGEELLMLADDPVSMYRRFAKHILVELPGTLLLDAVRDMRAAGEPITLSSLRQALLDRDVHTPRANKHMSLMRLWLDKAGVTTKAWQINEKLYAEIVGVSQTELDALVGLSTEQRAVLKVLAEVGTTVDSSELRVATERAFPVKLNEKAFSRLLKPLADAGFLSFQPAGGKSAPVKPEPRLLKDVTGPLLDQYGRGLPAKLRTLLRRPLADIVAALDSTSGYEKGLALEALGFKMMRSIGLDYRDTRFRPKQGGRFEVDLLFDTQRLAYSRWQIQCKNTARVDLDDVAKEVGLVFRLLSNVIVIITRGTVGNEARRYATDVMQKTSLAIVLIDGSDVGEIVKNSLVLYEILAREAAFAMGVKPIDAES
jgi:Restriction endonuclease